jgi:hypothetical protein
MSFVATKMVRAVILATATGLVALACPPVASADVIDVTVSVPDCPSPRTQWCPDPTKRFFPTDEAFFIEFTANRDHCADMRLHLYIDGNEWASNVVGPGQADGGYFIPVSPGVHNIAIMAEGIPGGCNTGFVSGWGGVLRIETNEDALNGRD